jgi:U3 small nucleolar RNA-associated protein 20
MHVLGYSVHHLLGKLVPTVQPGELDYCAPSLVKILLEDIFGEAAEKKEIDEIASSMKEARATRSFSSFQLLASVVQFAPNVARRTLLAWGVRRALLLMAGASHRSTSWCLPSALRCWRRRAGWIT